MFSEHVFQSTRAKMDNLRRAQPICLSLWVVFCYRRQLPPNTMDFVNFDEEKFATINKTSCDLFCNVAKELESLSTSALIGTSFGFGLLIVCVTAALVLCCLCPGLVFASCIARQRRRREGNRRRRRAPVRFAEPESTIIELREQRTVEVAQPEHTYRLSRYSGPRERGLRPVV